MQVGIRELKLRLSQYIRYVRAGERVLITHRGKPVARLEPPVPPSVPSGLQRLIEAGLVQDVGPPRNLPPPVPLLPGGKTVADIVSEQRG